MTTEPKALMVHIRGRVQGVGFRFWTQAEAQKLGLSGWVRNGSDGSVTARIAGPERAVSTMLQRFREGPPEASVSSVTSEAVDSDQPADGFNIVS
ncbi:acylphosphatase [Phyllobacterium sp. P5_D12]